MCNSIGGSKVALRSSYKMSVKTGQPVGCVIYSIVDEDISHIAIQGDLRKFKSV